MHALLLALLLLPLGCGSSVESAAEGKTQRLDFETTDKGKLPPGFKSDATHPDGAANAWSVEEREGAPSGKRVLALSAVPRWQDATFNLCWTRDISFQNGEIEVKILSSRGEVDQGGGVMWRAKDASNYYIARWNPLEDNFRAYHVKGGKRTQLATAKVKADPATWHTLRIVQAGNRIQGFLDGQKYLDVEDTTFPEAGGVGLWTKADAATFFDDLVVTSK
jgi:hypothetical protein